MDRNTIQYKYIFPTLHHRTDKLNHYFLPLSKNLRFYKISRYDQKEEGSYTYSIHASRQIKKEKTCWMDPNRP